MSRNTDDNWTIGNYKTNRYREVVGKNGEEDYIEVEIYGDGEYHIGKIDIDFLDRFTERTWNAYKGGNTFYMYGTETKKIPYKFIYSSFPNRGLLQLLRMWPKIVDKYQDASLHIYSDINGKWVNGVAKEMMNDIRLLLNIYEENDKTSRKKLNIFYYGWVNKSVLADAWKTSEYWFYPCTFMETFCLTAVEAALSKTIAITNGLAALQNTVSDRGICIPGDATTEEWQNRALNELFLIMNYKNKERREEFIEKNYEWACKLSWENQANNLLKIFLQN